jgi:L-amino acid N-acyltransferase YncA
MEIRPARKEDLAAVVAMAEARRKQYQEYQPVFWKKADDSEARTHAFFAVLVDEPELLFLVASDDSQDVNGFLIAKPFQVPPVYDPGGKTFFVDDFCVVRDELWQTVGPALLQEAASRAKADGGAQVVVVCGDRGRAKSDFLANTGHHRIELVDQTNLTAGAR